MKFRDLEPSTQIILKVVLTFAILTFLWLVRDIIVLILLAAVLAAAMEPLADYLHGKKIPRGASVAAVYLVVLGLAILIVSSIVPTVIEQLKVLGQTLPGTIADLQARYPIVSDILGGQDAGSFIGQFFQGDGQTSVVSRTVGVFSGIFGFITVLVISFYLVVGQQNGMKELIRSVVPPHRQDQIISLVSKIQRKMGLWVLGQFILSVAIFVLTYVGLSLLGVRYALALALLAGLLEVIPYIGPTLSAVPAVFFAFIQNPPLALFVLILYIIIQKLENYILVPKVMERTIGTSPLVVVVALLIGFKLAGVLGLLLAVPLAGALTVVIEELSARQHNQATS